MDWSWMDTVTFTVVMRNNGWHLGVDLDRDGLLDSDEFRDFLPGVPGWRNPFASNNGDSSGDNDFDGDGISNSDGIAAGSNPVDNLTDSPAFVANVGMVEGAQRRGPMGGRPLGSYKVQ